MSPIYTKILPNSWHLAGCGCDGAASVNRALGCTRCDLRLPLINTITLEYDRASDPHPPQQYGVVAVRYRSDQVMGPAHQLPLVRTQFAS